jgi:putative nucleotidyltransferase with HDIG domain
VIEFQSSENKLRERFYASLDGIKDIPTFPRVVARLAAVMARPACTTGEVAEAIQTDPAVTARLLKLVNSAFYRRTSGGAPIGSVAFAVTRVGLEEIRDLVTTLSVFTLFASPWRNVERVAFWKHCLGTALVARTIRRQTAERVAWPADADDLLHAAGLLHDIGIVVLDRYFRAEFTGLLAVARLVTVPLHEVETAMLGIDHPTVGATVARRWRLPPPIVEVLRWHHAPASAAVEWRPLTAAVALADYLCRESEAGLVDRSVEPVDREALDLLDLREDELPAILEATRARADESGLLAELAT